MGHWVSSLSHCWFDTVTPPRVLSIHVLRVMGLCLWDSEIPLLVLLFINCHIWSTSLTLFEFLPLQIGSNNHS